VPVQARYWQLMACLQGSWLLYYRLTTPVYKK